MKLYPLSQPKPTDSNIAVAVPLDDRLDYAYCVYEVVSIHDEEVWMRYSDYAGRMAMEVIARFRSYLHAEEFAQLIAPNYYKILIR